MCTSSISSWGSGMIYCFDLDGTICSSVEKSEYTKAKPDQLVINEINRLYDAGNIIKIMTARGSVSKIDHTELTKNQLNSWKLKYHELIMNKKPHADIFIDDRGTNINDWKKTIPNKYGIIAGAFDVIHPGYIEMFIDSKLQCTHLTVALHTDPSLENKKEKPILSWTDRVKILNSIKYIDCVIPYGSEKELEILLETGQYDIRFLGEDYINKQATGQNLTPEIFYLNRLHGWSTTKFKNMIRGLDA